MSQPHVSKLLGALIDGALGEAERNQVEAHLSECQRCAAEATQLRELRQAIGRLPLPAPSADLDRRIVRALVARSHVEPPVYSLAWRVLRTGVLASAAVIVLTLSGDLAYGLLGRSDTPVIAVRTSPSEMARADYWSQRLSEAMAPVETVPPPPRPSGTPKRQGTAPRKGAQSV